MNEGNPYREPVAGEQVATTAGRSTFRRVLMLAAAAGVFLLALDVFLLYWGNLSSSVVTPYETLRWEAEQEIMKLRQD